MNCNDAIELLPWLANGTLSPDERLAVTDHLRTCDACRAAWADTRTAWRVFDWHPAPGELIAHVAAEPNGGGPATADLEDHLAGCARCAAEVEMVRASRRLSEPVEEGAAGPLGALAADAAAPGTVHLLRTAKSGRDAAASPRRGWQRYPLAAGLAGLIGLAAVTGWVHSARRADDLEARLAAASRPGAATPIQASAATPAPVASGAAGISGTATPTETGATPATAATLALRRRAEEAEAKLAALAADRQKLATQVAALAALEHRTEENARLAGRQPDTAAPSDRAAHLTPAAERIEADTWTEEITAEGRAVRGGGGAVRSLPVSAGSGTIVLQGGQHGGFGEYALEIRDAQDRVVRSLSHLVPTRLDGEATGEDFYLTLPRGTLAPGTYSLHLFGVTGGHREPLDSYSIRVS